MKTLSKLKLHALKNESEFVLSKDKMKHVKGGGKVCNFYCNGYAIGAGGDNCYSYTCYGGEVTTCNCYEY